jgi:transcription initiation factor TFIIH subunit 2
MSSFSHLIRFQADDGKTYYGDLTKETPTREIEGSQVEVLEGDVISGFKKSGGKAKVEKLLCPLPTTNIVLCVGLNYRQHAEECNVSFLKLNYQLTRFDIRIIDDKPNTLLRNKD